MANHWGGAMPGSPPRPGLSPPGTSAYVRVESVQRVAEDEHGEADHRGDQHQQYGPFRSRLSGYLPDKSPQEVEHDLHVRTPPLAYMATLPRSDVQSARRQLPLRFSFRRCHAQTLPRSITRTDGARPRPAGSRCGHVVANAIGPAPSPRELGHVTDRHGPGASPNWGINSSFFHLFFIFC